MVKIIKKWIENLITKLLVLTSFGTKIFDLKEEEQKDNYSYSIRRKYHTHTVSDSMSRYCHKIISLHRAILGKFMHNLEIGDYNKKMKLYFRIQRWAKENKIKIVKTGVLITITALGTAGVSDLFDVWQMMGIQITGISGDITCGTICEAYVNVSTHSQIEYMIQTDFSGNWKFEPNITFNEKFYVFKNGKWEQIEHITFIRGNEYQLKVTAEKPKSDTVKWTASFGEEIDPYWYGLSGGINFKTEQSESYSIDLITNEEGILLNINDSSVVINKTEKSLQINGQVRKLPNSTNGTRYLGFSANGNYMNASSYLKYGDTTLVPADLTYKANKTWGSHYVEDIYYKSFNLNGGFEKEFELKIYFNSKPDNMYIYFGSGSVVVHLGAITSSTAEMWVDYGNGEYYKEDEMAIAGLGPTSGDIVTDSRSGDASWIDGNQYFHGTPEGCYIGGTKMVFNYLTPFLIQWNYDGEYEYNKSYYGEFSAYGDIITTAGNSYGALVRMDRKGVAGNCRNNYYYGGTGGSEPNIYCHEDSDANVRGYGRWQDTCSTGPAAGAVKIRNAALFRWSDGFTICVMHNNNMDPDGLATAQYQEGNDEINLKFGMDGTANYTLNSEFAQWFTIFDSTTAAEAQDRCWDALTRLEGISVPCTGTTCATNHTSFTFVTGGGWNESNIHAFPWHDGTSDELSEFSITQGNVSGWIYITGNNNYTGDNIYMYNSTTDFTDAKSNVYVHMQNISAAWTCQTGSSECSNGDLIGKVYNNTFPENGTVGQTRFHAKVWMDKGTTQYFVISATDQTPFASTCDTCSLINATKLIAGDIIFPNISVSDANTIKDVDGVGCNCWNEVVNIGFTNDTEVFSNTTAGWSNATSGYGQFNSTGFIINDAGSYQCQCFVTEDNYATNITCATNITFEAIISPSVGNLSCSFDGFNNWTNCGDAYPNGNLSSVRVYDISGADAGYSFNLVDEYDGNQTRIKDQNGTQVSDYYVYNVSSTYSNLTDSGNYTLNVTSTNEGGNSINSTRFEVNWGTLAAHVTTEAQSVVRFYNVTYQTSAECRGGECDDIWGTVYNDTTTVIGTTVKGDLWTEANPQYCGHLAIGELCNKTWYVNMSALAEDYDLTTSYGGNHTTEVANSTTAAITITILNAPQNVWTYPANMTTNDVTYVITDAKIPVNDYVNFTSYWTDDDGNTDVDSVNLTITSPNGTALLSNTNATEVKYPYWNHNGSYQFTFVGTWWINQSATDGDTVNWKNFTISVYDDTAPLFSNIINSTNSNEDVDFAMNVTWTDNSAKINHVYFEENSTGSLVNQTAQNNTSGGYPGVYNFTIPQAQLANQEYVCWRSIANDTGLNANYTTQQCFHVMNRQPNSDTTPLAPINLATVNDSTPTFTWTNGTDDDTEDNKNLCYYIDVWNTTTYNSSCQYNTGEGFNITTGLSNGWYSWRIKSSDRTIHGENPNSSWSAIQTFNVSAYSPDVLNQNSSIRTYNDSFLINTNPDYRDDVWINGTFADDDSNISNIIIETNISGSAVNTTLYEANLVNTKEVSYLINNTPVAGTNFTKEEPWYYKWYINDSNDNMLVTDPVNMTARNMTIWIGLPTDTNKPRVNATSSTGSFGMENQTLTTPILNIWGPEVATLNLTMRLNQTEPSCMDFYASTNGTLETDVDTLLTTYYVDVTYVPPATFEELWLFAVYNSCNPYDAFYGKFQVLLYQE